MNLRRTPAPLFTLSVLLAAWQALHMEAGSADVPAPLQTALRLGGLLATATFWSDAGATFVAFAAAWGLSVAGGIGIGVLLGASRPGRLIIEPLLANFYALPKVVLYPIVLACFGLGLAPKVAFGVMHALVPVSLFTTRAITQIRPVHRRAARSLRLSKLQTALRILLPAVLPELVGGVRAGAALSLLGVLIGEMFAAKRGLGFAAVNAVGLGDSTEIMAIGGFLVVCAVSVNAGLLAIERRLRHVGN